MTVPGYEIGRDDHGLTTREREVLGLMAVGFNQVEIGQTIGVKKQRVGQLMGALDKKGVTVSVTPRKITIGLPPRDRPSQ